MGVLHLLLAASALAAAQPAAPAADEHFPDAAEIAAALQSSLPQQLPEGVVLTAVRAEGPLLIMTMKIPASAPIGPFALNLARGLCLAPRTQARLERGLRVRIDTVSGDAAPVPGAVIERCPIS